MANEKWFGRFSINGIGQYVTVEFDNFEQALKWLNTEEDNISKDEIHNVPQDFFILYKEDSELYKKVKMGDGSFGYLEPNTRWIITIQNEE